MAPDYTTPDTVGPLNERIGIEWGMNQTLVCIKGNSCVCNFPTIRCGNSVYMPLGTPVKSDPVVQPRLPTDSAARKATPICTGVLDYFPLALAAVARLSKASNDKHNPGEPMHWAREKSTDHADCILRHQMERGTLDEFGFLHEVSVAWRALAQLEIALEGQR